MDNAEELPSWAARKHAPGSNLEVAEPPPPQPRRFRSIFLVLLGLLALVAMAGLGYFVASLTSDDDSSVATEDTDTSIASIASEADSTADEGASDDSATETAADDTAADDTATDADSTADADGAAGDGTADDTDDGAAAGDSESTDDDSASGEPVDNSDGSVRYAVLQGGQLYLRGRVPNEELGNQIEEVALGVLGPGNVINEYEVDPTTPDVVGGPVYVEDVVLFAFNSVEIEPAFFPILDLGTALMTQNPSVQMTVVSRTDAAGSEAVNMDVSRQRAQAVVEHWASKGIDASRLTIDPRGEEDASEDDTDEQAARNRRVEFVINNLFG